MDIIAAIVYGVLQGLTEFLPISSSAHLALLPHFTHLKEDPGIFFDLLLHLGTVVSVLIYYRHKLRQLWPLKQALPLSLIVATAISGSIMIFLELAVVDYGRRPAIIALNLAFWGLVFWWFDARAARQEKAGVESVSANTSSSLASVTSSSSSSLLSSWWSLLKMPLQGKVSYLKTAVVLGVAQAFAAFPGVSRSGITLTFARLLKIKKETAVEYSFLMAVPVILGGVLWKSAKMVLHPAAVNSLPPWPYVVASVLTSCLVGLAAIHGLLWALRQWGAAIFAIYRVVLAAVVWWVLCR